MTFVEDILSQMDNVYKAQVAFLLSYFSSLFCFQGRGNLSNLHRYGGPHPRTAYRWFQRNFDYVDFNLRCLKSSGVINKSCILALDATFLKKSGKRTHGLGWFHNGCSGRTERGLELSVVAAVDMKENTAYALDAQQILPKTDEGSLSQALHQLEKNRESFQEVSSLLVVDGWYAKASFVKAVTSQGYTVISKLRKDARLDYAYEGPYSGIGRPKLYDGPVDLSDLSRWEGAEYQGVRLCQKRLSYRAFKRRLNVVHIQSASSKRCLLLFSTDLSLSAQHIVQCYRARFQIEFLFRDAKQHTGLAQGQVRSKEAIRHHCNLSLAATNLLRLKDRRWQNTERHRVISLDDWKRWHYNLFFLNRLFSIFGLKADRDKSLIHIEKALNLGLIAA